MPQPLTIQEAYNKRLQRYQQISIALRNIKRIEEEIAIHRESAKNYMFPRKSPSNDHDNIKYLLAKSEVLISMLKEREETNEKQYWLDYMLDKYPVSLESKEKSYKNLSLLSDLLDLENGNEIETLTLDFETLNELPINHTKAIQLICRCIKDKSIKTLETDLELCRRDTQKDILQEALAGSNCTLQCNKPFGHPKTREQLTTASQAHPA